MGMSIDEAIKEGGISTVTTQEAEWVEVALDTMRKYQKIEQIISNYKGTSISCIQKIQEIVNDGTD